MNAPDFYEMFTLPEGVKKVGVHLDLKQPNTAIFEIQKEDHTLGNILTKKLHKDNRVLFSGYKSPHPLEHKILIRVQTTEETTPTGALKDAITSLLAELTNIKARFEFDLIRVKAEQEARQGGDPAAPGAGRSAYPADGIDGAAAVNLDVDF
ncbi:DNA-directed RNA polymerase II core subunit [Tieghemiomyces parasiticus]|uniref:DNA-directed RNA polymerase II core subunit n=1 Tax=Tieghemiomyces parasiticus TaxID=78921 RepID=A0A9W8DTR8_9FUNG|nr:DNA-directed RNA polymerase II core subunit [Tieghemiomyces parasiticus]